MSLGTHLGITQNSMSERSTSHSNLSETSLTLTQVIILKWRLSGRYTSLNLHSRTFFFTKMANMWLNRLENVDRLEQNVGHLRGEYNFDNDKYTVEEFRRRFRLTKAVGRWMRVENVQFRCTLCVTENFLRSLKDSNESNLLYFWKTAAYSLLPKR